MGVAREASFVRSSGRVVVQKLGYRCFPSAGFSKGTAPTQIKAAQSSFQEGRENGIFEVKPLSFAVFDRAKRLVEKRTLRLATNTLDVLPVASALVLGAGTSDTFDVNQGKRAKAEGLVVP